MIVKLTKMTSILFAGAAAAAIAAAPVVGADPPPPPPCFNSDGTPCAPAAGPEGAGAEVPGGPGAQAGPGGASAGVPGGPFAVAGPGGATACVPGYACTNIPAPPAP